LANYHLKELKGLNQACDARNLVSYDLVLLQRGAFLRADPVDVLSILKEVESDNLKQMILLPATDLQNAVIAENRLITKIANTVTEGAPDGFGIALLKTGSEYLCFIPSDKVEAHQQLLRGVQDKINFDMQANPKSRSRWTPPSSAPKGANAAPSMPRRWT
jgi:hypothetical protein